MKDNKNTVIDIYMPFETETIDWRYNHISTNILWLLQMDLAKNSYEARCIANVSFLYLKYCYPKITHEQLTIFIDLSSWCYLMDDAIEGNAIYKKIEDKISFLNSIKFICEQGINDYYGLHNNHILIKSFLNLKKRLDSFFSKEHFLLLMNSISDFVSGIVWELSVNNLENKYDLNTCCAIKTKSVGVLMAYNISLIINSVDLKSSIFEENDYIIMRNCMLITMAIDNDLYSFNKEYEQENTIFNMIDATKRNFNICLKSSILSVIEFRNHFIRKYIDIKNKLSAEYNINDISISLENLIYGNILFGINSDRYSKENKGNYFFSGPYKIKLNKKENFNNIEHIIKETPAISWWLLH